MSAVHLRECAGGAIGSDGGHATARGAADWLYLAAAPIFAAMAMLTAVPADSRPDILCLTAEHASPLSGMTTMYWLMSAFHLPPWQKLIASRRKRNPRARSYA